MANKKLKTIRFPGLSDTYTVPQVENGANNNVAVLDGAGNVKDSSIELSKVAKIDEVNELISGKLDANKLPEAIDDALAQAKASGEFDGANGITPTIGANGNWYLGNADTGKPSRGATGDTGPQGPQGPKGDPTDVQQTTGQSTTAVMSQKATTDEIDALKSDLDDLRTKKISLNIFDRNECTSGYMDTSGRVYTSQTLVYTPKIPVETGDVIRAYKNSSNGLVPTNMRFITAFLSTTGNANTYDGGTNVSEFTIVGSTNKIVITADENVDEITINYQPTSYEPKHDPYSVVKESALPRASETDFGVAKMWVTVDGDGNKVLNISTGDEK